MVINPTFGQTLGQTVESNYASGGFCSCANHNATIQRARGKQWNSTAVNGLFPTASLISTHKDLKGPTFRFLRGTSAMALLLLALVTWTVAEEDVCTLVQPRQSRPKSKSLQRETGRLDPARNMDGPRNMGKMRI
jgi:hypothetical protein